MLIFANEIQTNTKMKMKKSIISFALMLFAISASAQSTARKFVLKNSADGQSELTCYLPKKPTGVPWWIVLMAAIHIWLWIMRDISGRNISISRVSLTLS